MPNKKKKYADIGDRIVVLVPKMFIRCGYLVDANFLREKYTPEINRRVYQARKAANLPEDDRKVTSALEQAVILGMLREKEFGGRERVIIERDYRDWKVQSTYVLQVHTGQIGTVREKKRVVTGTYNPGYESYTYWENEWNGEFPSLENQKHHMVYKTDWFSILAEHTITIEQWMVTRALQRDEERKEQEIQRVQYELDKFGGKNVFTSF